MADEKKDVQQKPEAISPVTPPPPLFVDETFDFKDFEKEPPQHFSVWFWGQWIVLIGVGFGLLSVLSGGFENLSQYGWSPTGVNYALLLSKTEKLFGLGLLAMLPAAVFLIIAFERKLAAPLEATTRWVLSPNRLRWLVPALVLVCGALVVMFALFVLEDSPLTDDENVYLFQTRIFANGHLTLPSLPNDGELPDRLFEDNIFLVNNGKIFGQYPLGQSLTLLVGYLIGWPRLTSVCWALLTVVGVFFLIRQIYGERFAFIAALLTAFSPM